jgi:hypothetical protein
MTLIGRFLSNYAIRSSTDVLEPSEQMQYRQDFSRLTE